MVKGRVRFFFLLFMVGLVAGLLIGLNKVMATSPVDEVSGGEAVASVWYDEHWRAIRAVVSSEDGYDYFNPSTHNDTEVAGRMEQIDDVWITSLYPKMVVTKWRVHGHIHFE